MEMNNIQPSPPRAVIATDRPGWAFHHIAEQITANIPGYIFSIIPYSEIANVSADLLICLWWRSLEQLVSENNFRRTILCVYDHYSWCNTPHDIFEFAQSANSANVIGVSNIELAQKINIRKSILVQSGLKSMPPIYLIEDGVDCDMFRPISPPPTELTLGWCGNSRAARGHVKGLELIKAACMKDRSVTLKTIDVSDGDFKSHNDMPSWYNSLSAYVCASAAEGTPNPVLEALACGRPVITTRCGLTTRAIQDGVSGFFCDRTVPSICDSIDKLRHRDIMTMSSAARLAGKVHSWEHKIPMWEAAISGAMAKWL